MEHSIFSPSKLSRIMACPASAYIPDETDPNDAAKRGTRLHQVVVDACDLGIKNLKFVDKEDLELIKACLDYKDGIIKSFNHDEYNTAQEIQVKLNHWNLSEVYGTLDFSIMDYKNKHLHVIDWKFGSGVIVYANMNEQLLAYAAGVLNETQDIEIITLHIFQPSIDHIDTYTLTKGKLINWLAKLREAVTLGKSSKPPVCPGEKQCKWCPIACEARYKQAQQDAREVFAVTNISVPAQIGNDQIAKVLKNIPRLKDFIKKVQIYAHKELEQGRAIPGYKLVSGRSNRKWRDEDLAIKWLDKNLPNTSIFETKLKSCSKLEKLDRSLKKNKEFGSLIIKPQGKANLVEESDKREAIQPSSVAIDVFSDYGI